MENPNERNLQRRGELMGKYGHIIAKAAREKELEKEKEREKEREMKRERELERIVKAERDAAVREKKEKELEREREMKRERELRRIAKAKRIAAALEHREEEQAKRIRKQPRLSKTDRSAPPGAMTNTVTMTVETADMETADILYIPPGPSMENPKKMTVETADVLYVAPGLSVENPNERNLQRWSELMDKYGLIISKAAREKEEEKEKELEREWEMKRERELERIVEAIRVAEVREKNEREQVMRNRLGIRRQPRFSKMASHGAVETGGSLTYNVPQVLMAAISELYGSPSIFDEKTGQAPVGSGD